MSSQIDATLYLIPVGGNIVHGVVHWADPVLAAEGARHLAVVRALVRGGERRDARRGE